MAETLKSKSGRALTKAQLDRLAKQAEEGFDLSTWKPRRGRPALDAAHDEPSPRIAVRVPQPLYDRVLQRAEDEDRSVSAVVRELLEGYAPGGATLNRSRGAGPTRARPRPRS